MSTWQDTVAGRLRGLRRAVVANRILVFAVLATLIPTLVTTCLSYRAQQRLLAAAMSEELRAASAEAAQDIDLWFGARVGDLRGAAASYVVTDNLARTQGKDAAKAVSRLRDYLSAVRERYLDQEAVAVLDMRARVVATSSGRVGALRLPGEGLNELRSGEALVGDPYWDGALGRAAVVVAVPVREADGLFVGALAAKLSLRTVTEVLQRRSAADPLDVYLVTSDGRLITRANQSSAELMRTKLSDTTRTVLTEREGQSVAYTRPDGGLVVGTLRRVPALRWAVVAEMHQVETMQRLGRLRSLTMLMIVAVLGGVALMAFVLSTLLLRPVGRLSAAAAQVAAGDLSVELPAAGSGAIGYLTQVFNTLVSRLRERESEGELERLSVTDALTGLYNRRHLMGTLASEVQRTRRLRRPFSVVMLDVDHFKRYNDTHGHLEGDAALAKLADLLRKTTRGVDCVARYGGEEFFVMLIETTVATAVIVAERIRSRVAAEQFGGGRMTVSIGVAECPGHGDTPEALIASADAALYQAKGEGRDRVVTARAEPAKKSRRKGDQ